jgi:hypothetical protein
MVNTYYYYYYYNINIHNMFANMNSVLLLFYNIYIYFLYSYEQNTRAVFP